MKNNTGSGFTVQGSRFRIHSVFSLTVLLIIVLMPLIAFPAEVQDLALYQCRSTAKPPVIDGKLDDDCWNKAEEHTEFYKYWVGGPPAYRTGFRLLYGEKGIYLGIYMYAGFNKPEKFRANHTQRDDGDIWGDDCAEIYFDPACSGIGYLKFVSNFLGTRFDEKRMDPANTDAAWSPEGWKVACSRSGADWFMECFFPWKDLETKPLSDEIWCFGLVRYAYAVGVEGPWTFGVSWPERASYTSPGNFGFIYFSPGKSSLNALFQTIKKYVSGAWELPAGDGVYYYPGKGEPQFIKFTDKVKILKEPVPKKITEVETLLQKTKDENLKKKTEEKLKEIKKQTAELPEKISNTPEFRQAAESLRKIREDMENLEYELKLDELINSQK